MVVRPGAIPRDRTSGLNPTQGYRFSKDSTTLLTTLEASLVAWRVLDAGMRVSHPR